MDVCTIKSNIVYPPGYYRRQVDEFGIVIETEKRKCDIYIRWSFSTTDIKFYIDLTLVKSGGVDDYGNRYGSSVYRT